MGILGLAKRGLRLHFPGFGADDFVAQATARVSSSPPVPYASVSELNLLLSQLEQVSQSAQVDLAKLRIEKWKTDGNTRRGTQSDVEIYSTQPAERAPGNHWTTPRLSRKRRRHVQALSQSGRAIRCPRAGGRIGGRFWIEG